MKLNLLVMMVITKQPLSLHATCNLFAQRSLNSAVQLNTQHFSLSPCLYLEDECMGTPALQNLLIGWERQS